MLVNFTKMHGLGNDFVVVDLITQSAKLLSAHLKRIADRRFGIGCDQVLVIEPPIRPDSDFYYRIYNADGQEVEQCGNGARCVAKFVLDAGLAHKPLLTADCLAGPITLQIEDDQLVTVNLPTTSSDIVTHSLNYEQLPSEIHTTSLGNPHGVCLVKDLGATSVENLGPSLSALPIFPAGANIGFMQVIDRSRIRLQVYERGVGATLACGTGACAAMLIGKHLNLLDNRVTVMFPRGELTLVHQDTNQLLRMTGPATSVFTGKFRL